jgi:NADH-quinone oxidoreductase subunit K
VLNFGLWRKIMNEVITLDHYLFVSMIILGLLINGKNLINVLMSIELMLLSVSINFVTFSVYWNDVMGQVASIIVLTVAAAESAIGLAIIVAWYRNSGSVSMSDVNNLKG